MKFSPDGDEVVLEMSVYETPDDRPTPTEDGAVHSKVPGTVIVSENGDLLESPLSGHDHHS